MRIMSIIGGKGMFAAPGADDVSVTHDPSCDFIEACRYALRENWIQSSVVRCLRNFKFSISSRSKAMQITKFLVVAVVLCGGAEVVIPTSSADDESTLILLEVLVKMVTSCYKGRINAVGLVGNFPDTIIETLSVQHLIPTVLMDYTMMDDHMIRATTFLPVANEFRYKLKLFVIEVPSTKPLATIIVQIIQTSIWWNQMASFIILDQTPDCRTSADYLFIAWQHNLINAKVMCFFRIERKPAFFVFNYNPFTNQAPVSWTPVEVYNGLNNHEFTLFVRRYRGNEAICVDLDFVKTNNLGGYEITVDGNNEVFVFKDKKYERTSQAWAGQKMVLHSMFRVLNAISKFTGQRTLAITTLNADMLMRPIPTARGDGFSYPYQQHGVVIVSNFKGHKSQLEKILSVTDVDTRIGMGIVYLITLIFFKFFVHQALMPAILNLVRMTCNTGFANLNDNTAPRLYLTGLLFFVVTMQGIYQGNLASLLTNKIPYPNINSLNDLVNCDCKIYGSPAMYFLLEDSSLKERFISTDYPYECMMHVVDDLSAVCLQFADGLTMDMAAQYDLHLSNEFVTQIPISFLFRESWYLEERMNRILGTMVEADIFETWERKCNPIKLSDFKYDKEVLKNTDYKVMELTELLFAFVILGIGLTCATVVFIIEVATY